MIGDGCGLESSLTMTGNICDRLKIVEARYEVEQDFCRSNAKELKFRRVA
jgi:hypothetical protein